MPCANSMTCHARAARRQRGTRLVAGWHYLLPSHSAVVLPPCRLACIHDGGRPGCPLSPESCATVSCAVYLAPYLVVFLFALCRPQHLLPRTQPRTTSPPTQILTVLLAWRPRLSSPLYPSQVMHQALAPSLCFLVFTRGSGICSSVQDTPQ